MTKVVLTGDGVHGTSCSVRIGNVFYALSVDTPTDILDDQKAKDMIETFDDVIAYKESDHKKVLKGLEDTAKAENAEAAAKAPKPRKGATYPKRGDVGPATKEG